MDSLLCDEVWLTSPPTTVNHNHATTKFKSESYSCTLCTTKEDCERDFALCLQKEVSYMAQSGYQYHLQSSGLVLARFRAMQWLVKSQSRLNLSCQTTFNAANYLDRFLSMNQFYGWKYWMIELLAIACLSVASKFGETTHPPLHQIQMEDLDRTFQSGVIQRMELTLLKALDWKLGSITAYSYIELLVCDIENSLNSFLLGELTTRVTELLFATLSDSKFVEFRPSVIAISALNCAFKELIPSTSCNAHLAHLTILTPQDQKDELIKCHKIMEEKSCYKVHSVLAQRGYSYYCPSSPITMLTRERVEISKFPISFDINLKSSNMKRKREG